MRTLVLGEFSTPADLIEAARTVRALGYRELDAHTPYPVDGVAEALALPRSTVPAYMLLGGVTGASFGYLMQWWCNGVDYPINVGGRPLQSAPAFIPITFELGILCCALAGFFALLGLSRLPKPWHPAFESNAFRRASIDTYWLSVGHDGSADERQKLVRELEGLGARVTHVGADE